MSPKRLDQLINTGNNSELAGVIKRAEKAGELVDALQRALPAAAGASIVAANIRDDGTLVVLARSSAWASRLRYEAVAMLAALESTGMAASRCEVRVARSEGEG